MESQSNTAIDDKPKKNILMGFIFDFFKQNILWLIITITVLFITSPLEMIVLSSLFSDFTGAINKLDYSNSINRLWKIAGLYTLLDVI